MARNRTATNILDARGAFKQNPDRQRKKEPKPKGAFPKSVPRHLTPEAKKCWREIVKVAPANVLTSADVIQVEVVAELLAEFRAGPRHMVAARLTRLSAEMHKLGLNPSGRASIEVDEPEEDEFGDLVT